MYYNGKIFTFANGAVLHLRNAFWRRLPLANGAVLHLGADQNGAVWHLGAERVL